MMHYEVHFKDHGGHVFSVGHLQAASDRQAIARARRLYRSGIGESYEIWRRGVHLHSELIVSSTASHPAFRHPQSDDLDAITEHMHACIRQAVASEDRDLQRRLLKETEDCLRQIADADQPRHAYRLQLRDGQAALVAELVIRAEDNEEALRTATVLADSLAGLCMRFDLWRGGEWVGSAGVPFRVPDTRELGRLAQCIVLEREIALPDSPRSTDERQALDARSWAASGKA